MDRTSWGHQWWLTDLRNSRYNNWLFAVVHFLSVLTVSPLQQQTNFMPPVVIDVRSAADPRDVVHRAVQALVEGQIVTFPTETVYGIAASARNEAAVERLLEAKKRTKNQPLTLVIKSADEAYDYVPGISLLGRRLARRCWPGPITLVAPADHPHSLIQQLPANVREAIAPNGTVGLRVPAHPLVLDVLRLLAGPIVLSSANLSGQPDAITAQQVMDAMGEEIPFIFDDGRSKFGQPSSVVRVHDGELEMLREGVVSEATLQRLSSLLILFVCTGNTCRSPMAELLMRKHFAARLGCGIEDLQDRGINVFSAGIAAMAGGRPSHEAVEVMGKMSLDLCSHESQPLSERLVRHADMIFTMTCSHRDAIISQWPSASERTQLLCQDESDVPDPIGGSLSVYQHCADHLNTEIEVRAAELDLDKLVSRIIHPT